MVDALGLGSSNFSCKSSSLFIRSFVNLILKKRYFNLMIEVSWGRGGIGRHDGLKIRCLVIVREGSIPSVPILKN